VTRRDLYLLGMVCLLWGGNFIAIKLALAETTPLLMITLRFTLVVVLLAPWLRPVPQRIGRVVFVAILFGPLHFGALFTALARVNASTVALVLLSYVPLSVVFSMLLLKERPGPRRLAGIVTACAGTVVIAANPDIALDPLGVFAAFVAAAAMALATVVMPTLGPVGPLKLQGWISLVSLPIGLAATAAFEGLDVPARIATMGDRAWLGVCYTAIFGSVVAHGTYYRIVTRNDVTLAAPTTLLATVVGATLSVAVLGDPVTAQMLAGAAISLAGLVLLLWRQVGRRLPGVTPASVTAEGPSDGRPNVQGTSE